MKQKTFRKGVIGALLDEYEVVIDDLKNTVKDINREDLVQVVDRKTKNPDCVSIQSVLTHIVLWGYHYITMIDRHKGNSKSPWKKRKLYDNIRDYCDALDEMFEHNVRFFDNISEKEMTAFKPADKIKTGWNQLYDYEQLMEHAIVHVSRHRRQIEKFKIILSAQ